MEGTVAQGSKPVAGAAVAVGSQLVYTDSDGHWMARFARNTPVRVSVQPSEFLTTATYCARTEARIQSPATDAVPLVLQVERCRAVPVVQATTAAEDSEPAAHHRSALRAVGTFAYQVVHLWTRKSRV